MEEFTQDEILMMDWAVYNEILRYIRQDLSKLSAKEKYRYENLQSLRKKITNFVEDRAIVRAFSSDG